MDRAQTLSRKAVAKAQQSPPDWLVALRGDPASTTLGVTWLDDAGIAEDAENVEERPSDWGLHTNATMQHIRLNRPHLVEVGSGPEFTRRGMGVAGEAAWLIDTRDPRQLLFAPDRDYRTFLHVPAGTTAETMAQVLSSYFPSPRPTRLTLPKVARGFLGYLERLSVPSPYSGQLEAVNGLTLDRYFTMNGYTEVSSWGSAYPDDPYPEESLPMLQLAGISREASQQGDGVPSMTRRTAHSGSYLTFEAHFGQLLVGEVRYRPTSHPQMVEAMNAAFGSYFPTDLPVDVIGALMGFDFMTIDMMEQELARETDPGNVLGQLQIATALTYGDLDAFARLRRYFDHEDASYRAQALNFLLPYNYEFLLEELVLTEPDAELAGQVQRILNEGISNRHPDAFEGGDDYDDDHEDDEDEDDE